MPVTIPKIFQSDYFGATPALDALVAKIPGYRYSDDGSYFIKNIGRKTKRQDYINYLSRNGFSRKKLKRLSTAELRQAVKLIKMK